jgi:hypothetical protein
MRAIECLKGPIFAVYRPVSKSTQHNYGYLEEFTFVIFSCHGDFRQHGSYGSLESIL